MTFVTLAFALTTLAAGPASAQSGSPPPMDREMAREFIEAIHGGKLTIHEEEIVGDTLEIRVNMAGWIPVEQLEGNTEISVGADLEGYEIGGYIAPLPHFEVMYVPKDGDQGEGDLEIWTLGHENLEPALFTQNEGSTHIRVGQKIEGVRTSSLTGRTIDLTGREVKYLFKEAGRFFIYVGAQEPKVVDPRLPVADRRLRSTRVYITQTN